MKLPEENHIPDFTEQLKTSVDVKALVLACENRILVISEQMSDEFLHFNNPDKYIELIDDRDCIQNFLNLIK